MVLLLLLVLLGVTPVVEADAGDFHKWAVIVGTFLGSTVVLGILCFIVYYVFVKRWLDDYLSDPTYRQDAVHYSQPKVYEQPHQQKMNVWNPNNRNGALSNGDPKYSSDARFDQNYGGGGGGYQTKTQWSNNQAHPSNGAAALNYQQAYQQAIAHSYNSDPNLGVGPQIAAHNNQFGLPPRSTVIVQDPYNSYNSYNSYVSPAERQQQNPQAYRPSNTTHTNQLLSAAYIGSSV
uniref:Uncharacterized protein n=1 Tax=Plectus sambesii TaxID=2011161 RepID=A0A914WJN8_9BILA